MGVSQPDAEYYAEAVRRGGALVTVRADDARAERAADIMRAHGAIDIERRAEQWRERGWTGFDDKAQPYTPTISTATAISTASATVRPALRAARPPAVRPRRDRAASIPDRATAGSKRTTATPRTDRRPHLLKRANDSAGRSDAGRS